MSQTKGFTEVDTRWLIRRDMREVLEIENQGFGTPWSEKDFLIALRDRRTIGLVAVQHSKVLGFVVYELHRGRLQLINFGVAMNQRRAGIGRQMIERLKEKLINQHREEIRIEVHERNLDIQLFLKAMGFLCVRVLCSREGHGSADFYQFSYFRVDGYDV